MRAINSAQLVSASLKSNFVAVEVTTKAGVNMSRKAIKLPRGIEEDIIVHERENCQHCAHCS